MVSQLSKKAALPLAKILATCRNNVSYTGPWSFVREASWPVMQKASWRLVARNPVSKVKWGKHHVPSAYNDSQIIGSLMHSGHRTHMCVVEPDNFWWSPVQNQGMTRNNAHLLSIGPSGSNFKETLTKIFFMIKSRGARTTLCGSDLS